MVLEKGQFHQVNPAGARHRVCAKKGVRFLTLIYPFDLRVKEFPQAIEVNGTLIKVDPE
jgi:hypothetical protein